MLPVFRTCIALFHAKPMRWRLSRMDVTAQSMHTADGSETIAVDSKTNSSHSVR